MPEYADYTEKSIPVCHSLLKRMPKVIGITQMECRLDATE